MYGQRLTEIPFHMLSLIEITQLYAYLACMYGEDDLKTKELVGYMGSMNYYSYDVNVLTATIDELEKDNCQLLYQRTQLENRINDLENELDIAKNSEG